MGSDPGSRDFRESQNNLPETPSDSDEPPPFLGTWNRVYAAVLIYTCILVLALYGITLALNR